MSVAPCPAPPAAAAPHPAAILYRETRPFPALPVCEHYAGNEKLMRRALALQHTLGPVFDLTCDCEDGAPAGAEIDQAKLIASVIASADNRFGRIGARIHDIAHPHWRDELDIIVSAAGDRLAYVTFPKAGGRQDVQLMLMTLAAIVKANGIEQPIPAHVLIETHGALREVEEIAALPGIETLDFGLMDFVSGHHGAIPASAMRSPGQFTHPLVARAKCAIAAAALGHGLVPAHNVTTELRDAQATWADARRARDEFGYLRMWSIHPNQIEPIIDAMRPGFDEVSAAAAILIAAQAADWGPIRQDDRLHDRASYRYYWELLQRARVTGMDVPDEARRRFFSATA
ncbi:MAG: CoA ester lyase [Zoogloeaceae bacterium]|nr:CoA ester lyase [Zoogloeaceae bacterium]